MNFCLNVGILLLALTKTTLQSCGTFDISQKSSPDGEQYIHCENEPILADFHTKLPHVEVEFLVKWLEINNTISPIIEKGAFDNLTVPELRILEAGVCEINPGAFSSIKNLTKLLLKSNKLTDIKEYFFTDLDNLEVLDLSHNDIMMLSEGSFLSLKALKELNLQGNLLTNINLQILKTLTKLEILNLSFNKVTHIGNGSFENSPKLADLFLNNNNMAECDSSILSANLNLRNVFLNNNYLKKLDITFSGSPSKLNVSHNFIQSVSFSKEIKIRKIDLSANGISSLRNFSLKNLTVEYLFLDQNQFGPIASNIFGGLPFLHTISLSANQIRKVDKNLLKNNRQLRILNLARNQLSSQNSFYIPTSLYELHLTFNNFDSNFDITSLFHLNVLDVRYNNFTDIPFNFFQGVFWMYRIDFSYNKITKISVGCFRNSKRLFRINLSHNYISVLEVGVFLGLDQLSDLDISYNMLTTINDDVFHTLKALYALDLGYNNVSYSSFENALVHLSALKKVALNGNGWTCNDLSNIAKNCQKIDIIDGTNYDVANVDGVACENEVINSDEVVDFETISFSTVDSKLVAINVLLILILLVLVFKVFINHVPCSGKFKIKGTLQRKRTEKRQLVETS